MVGAGLLPAGIFALMVRFFATVFLIGSLIAKCACGIKGLVMKPL